MEATFEPVETPGEQERLAALADEIWHEYWPAIIGPEQTDYMVEQFQSLGAIRRDMAENAYEYWILRAEDDGRVVGYTGGHVEPETNRFFVSKIYLRAEERGRGFASATVRFYEGLCRERGLARSPLQRRCRAADARGNPARPRSHGARRRVASLLPPRGRRGRSSSRSRCPSCKSPSSCTFPTWR